MTQMLVVVLLCLSWGRRTRNGDEYSKQKKFELFKRLARKMNFRTFEDLLKKVSRDQFKIIPKNATRAGRSFGKFCRMSTDTSVNKWNLNFVVKRFNNQTFLFTSKRESLMKIYAQELNGNWSDFSLLDNPFTNSSGFGFSGEIGHRPINGLTPETAESIVNLLRSKNTTFLECLIESSDALENISSEFMGNLQNFLFRTPNIDIILELFEMADTPTRIDIIELAIAHKSHWKLLRSIIYNENLNHPGKKKNITGLTTFCQYLFSAELLPLRKWMENLINPNVTKTLPSQRSFSDSFTTQIKNITKNLRNENKVFLRNLQVGLNIMYPQKGGGKRFKYLLRMLVTQGILDTFNATNENTSARIDTLRSYVSNTSIVQTGTRRRAPEIMTAMEHLASAKSQVGRKDFFDIDTSDETLNKKLRNLLVLIKKEREHLKKCFTRGNVYKHKYIAETAFWMFLDHHRK